MDSIGNDVSFMDLLSMVAANAANSDVKVHHAVQLHEDLVIGTEEQVLAKQQITHNNKRSSASMDGGISNGNTDCRMESVVHPVPVLSEREYHGGTIEESMRKYCEDKKRVMFEPEIGMEFSSTEEAFQYYNMYSWVTGFSIRLGDNYTTKTKQRTMQEYLCRRQGNGDETKHSTTRCGCKAMMRVSTNGSCKWYVKKVNCRTQP
ncbi:protein FAR1-RELATED SEQUENCE 6-like [Lolium perenne]|uniref:protein FAR1-RELATED SEQUENCE 6-like n=1 Tax=Lolium perenne TaxID=4522 RepID=UPI0021F5D29C|nr:protein FAR1-RELATED SEQUENCE 6-like isoform X3 [Lolium perenne]XP_051177017.1 protein FAR1-RELATED SEQUENCE 6-like isoform X3 [Lolium perenne]